MLISQVAIVISASQVEELEGNSKITAQLKEKMDSVEDDEYIPVYIWLNSHNDFVVYEALSRTYNEEINVENEQLFIDSRTQNSLDELKAEINSFDKDTNSRANFDTKKKHIKNTKAGSRLSDDQIERFLESDDRQQEIIANVEQTQYISEWRNARYNINQFINREFEKRLDMERCRNVSPDIQLAFVELETTKSYIYELEKLNMVDSIGLLFSEEDVSIETSTETEVSENNSYNYHMNPIDGLENYDGTNIKIGVIEYIELNSNGKYEIGFTRYAPHFFNKVLGEDIITYEDLWNDSDNVLRGSMTEHARSVLSILWGDSAESDYSVTENETTIPSGTVYGGIAPNAKIFYSCYRENDDDENDEYKYLKKSIRWCISKNVSVINMSFRAGKEHVYDYMDRYLDCIITQYRVSIVKSSGNDSADNNVTSPGLAYNVITVGNMTANVDSAGKYIISGDSCYNEENYLPNKPDICAFGTNIVMLTKNGLNKNTQYTVGSGTSFAAPMVTGTIALMMQANPSLVGNPTMVKAILMNTASTTNISTTNDGYADWDYFNCNYSYVDAEVVLREKTGAGLLNIPAAVASSILSKSFSVRVDSSIDTIKTGNYYFNAGQKIKATLVFEKNYYEMIDSADIKTTNFALSMRNANNNQVVSTFSEVNNVQMFEGEIETSGLYYFEIINLNYFEGTETMNIEGTSKSIEPLDFIYAALVFSCGCSRPEYEAICNGGNHHIFKCKNDECGWQVKEMHNTAINGVAFENASVKFEINYLYTLNSSEIPYQIWCYEYKVDSSAENVNHSVQTTLNAQSNETATGTETEILSYTIKVNDENSVNINTYYVTVRIIKNYLEGTISIVVS
ncbi:MAG: S8/S53 family peptidase [Clostridia bacterium]|nr:S8/S53 family peptidase [Clostridia bacterium]